MKYIVAMMMCMMAFSAHAQMSAEQMKMMQQYGGMNPEQMQQQLQKMQENMPKMMENAQEVQKCIGNIGKEKFDELEARANTITAKVKSLCAAGEEFEAKQYAMREGMKMQNDPTVKTLQACSSEMVAHFTFTPPMASGKETSICDQ